MKLAFPPVNHVTYFSIYWWLHYSCKPSENANIWGCCALCVCIFRNVILACLALTNSLLPICITIYMEISLITVCIPRFSFAAPFFFQVYDAITQTSSNTCWIQAIDFESQVEKSQDMMCCTFSIGSVDYESQSGCLLGNNACITIPKIVRLPEAD